VIIWTSFKIFAIGQNNIAWPGLHRLISITLYNNKPYDAVWAFQPLGTGTAILLSAIITAVIVRLSPAAFLSCIAQTIRQCWLAVLTVMLIVGLAYLMNYSGLAYTLGKGVASTGHLFAIPWLDRGHAVRQRHVRQRSVRQSPGCCRSPA
jgi:lactate permease